MDQSRRSFLYAASASASLAFIAACSNNSGNNAVATNTAPPGNTGPEPTPEPAKLDPTDRRGTLIGPGGRDTPDGNAEFWLRLADLEKIEQYVRREAKPAAIMMAFQGHGILPHPVQTTRAAVFTKWGPGGCEVDFKTLQVTRDILPTPGREFYGHGAWSKDGKLLYAVEALPRKQGNYDGYIVIRDADNMQVLGEFPTHGVAPHDCHILDDGKTLAITNGGGGPGSEVPGCVTFVDIATEKLLERVTIPVYQAGHLTITGRSSQGDLAIGSTPHSPPGTGPDGYKSIPGGLTVRPSGGGAIHVSEPEDVKSRMLGETLSLAIHDEYNIVGCTNPDGNIYTFWDVKTGSFLKSFSLDKACGIALTLDKRYFVVTARTKYTVQLVRAKDLQLVEDATFTLSGINGSHCIIHDL